MWGAILISLGLVLIGLRRVLGVQVRCQPRWMHPWGRTRGAALNRSLAVVLGVALVVSGVVEIAFGRGASR